MGISCCRTDDVIEVRGESTRDIKSGFVSILDDGMDKKAELKVGSDRRSLAGKVQVNGKLEGPIFATVYLTNIDEDEEIYHLKAEPGTDWHDCVPEGKSDQLTNLGCSPDGSCPIP